MSAVLAARKNSIGGEEGGREGGREHPKGQRIRVKTERPIKEKEEADDSQGRTDMKSKWVLTEVAMLLGALLAFLSLPEASLSHSLH